MKFNVNGLLLTEREFVKRARTEILRSDGTLLVKVLIFTPGPPKSEKVPPVADG